MNTQTFSRGQCLASHICKGSSLRPRQAAHVHLSSVQRLSQANAELATPRGSTCSTRRLLTTTRAENGNGASPAPSGLSIDLRGSLDVARRHTHMFGGLSGYWARMLLQARRPSSLVLRTIRQVDCCGDILVLTHATTRKIKFINVNAGVRLGHSQAIGRGWSRDLSRCLGETCGHWLTYWQQALGTLVKIAWKSCGMPSGTCTVHL